MAKERVEYEVVGRDVGGSKAFRDVGDAAAKAGDQVEGLGKTAADTGDQVGKSGDQAEGAAKEYRGLAAEIEIAQAEMRRLAVEIDKTGNMDLAKDLRSQQRELRKLMNIRKSMGDPIQMGDLIDLGGKKGKGGLLDFALDEWAANAGKTIAAGVGSGLQSAGRLAGSNPYLAAGIAAGITLGTPLIGAAVTAAVGGGVIAGGILLASKDPRVGSAWSAVGESAKGKLTSAAAGFVGPLIHGAETFDATLGRILPNIEADFNRLAPVADKLFTGAAGAVEALMPGIDALSTEAGPILTDLADELPRLGAAISQMSQDIASGGAGGAQAMRDFLGLVEVSILATGQLIGALEKWYLVERSIASMATGDWDGAIGRMTQVMYTTGQITPVADRATAAYRVFTTALGATGRGAVLTADQMKTLSQQINTTALTSDILAGQMVNKLLTSMMSLDQATLGFAQSQTQVTESIKSNGTELDIHTVKGQTNTGAILGSIQANMQQYQANIAVGMSAGDAAAAYDVNTAALENQLRQAGMTQGAIDGLIGKYRGVPGKVNTDIATQGLTTAIEHLDDLIRRINNIPTRRDIYITEHLSTTGGFSYKSPDRLYDYPAGGNAGGGLIRGPGTGTSDDIVRRVSNGEYVLRAAAVSALGVDVLDRLNHADRNAGALTAAAPTPGGGTSTGTRRGGDREFARLIADEFARALSRATLKIDDRTGRLVDLYSRAG